MSRISCCHGVGKRYALPSLKLVNNRIRSLNSELCRKALEKVVNPNILVNVVSRRVRQLNSGGGASNRPLVAGAENLGAADTALLEVLEDKITFERPPEAMLPEPALRKRKRS